jgi:hypothetical protein
MARSKAFIDDVQKFSKKVGLSTGTVVRKLSLDALGGMMRRTPVDTGRLRASWRVSLNSPDTSVAPEGAAGSGGGDASGSELADATAKLGAFKLGDSVHISNSLEYAEFVEEDAHMFADTLTELEELVGRAARRK